jgi:hypothetical protein
MVGALKSAVVPYFCYVTYFYKCMQEESEYFDTVSLCVAFFQVLVRSLVLHELF